MPADNSAALHAAQRARHDELIANVMAAVRRLRRAGTPITFNAVANAAGVSRAFLYKTPETRTAIEQARNAKPTREPPRTRRHPDIDKLRADNTRLHNELRVLIERNERLLGLLREAKGNRA